MQSLLSTFKEKFSAEVESWMTGEQFAGWMLSARGCDKRSRGWSVSMLTGNTWQDLLGSDFVLDLIGEMEEASNPSSPSDPVLHQGSRTPVSPLMFSPILCSSPLPKTPSVHPLCLCSAQTCLWVAFYWEVHLSELRQCCFFLMQDLENRESLTRRMKGGGKIGPPQRGIFPSTGHTQLHAVAQAPWGTIACGYLQRCISSTAMYMPQPVVPTVDPSQLAAQQQAFINQQAMLMAQQMTLQAMTLSQQQQQQQQRQQWRQQPPESSRPRASSPPQSQAPAPAPATSPKPNVSPSNRDVTPPPKAPEPPAQAERPVGETSSGFRYKGIFPVLLFVYRLKLSPPTAPAAPLPPPEPKPKKQTPKARKEPPVVKSSAPESRPEPSREIRNIIKMYQSRPAPEPQPIEPARVSKPFMKRNDPKNEALAKLGMMNLNSPKSVSKKPKGTPPPTKPKPGSASSSIKEKQIPLLSIFREPSSTPPDSPAPPVLPPLPSSFPPGNQGLQEFTSKGECLTVTEDDGIKTQLYKLTAGVNFSYFNPPWKIFLRKEVFYPKENFSHPYCLNLLCEQIIRDTFSDSCLRISKEEKRKMKDLLGNESPSIQEDGIKKRIVVAARDNWANYFSRLFPVQGENGSDVQILGVSHRGLRLLKVVKAAAYAPEHLKVLCSYSFADVLSVELKDSNSLEFSLKTEQLLLHSHKAPCIKATVELFILELRQDTNYVVALRSYVTDDKSLLSFKKGDLIQLLPMQGLEPGWQFGSTGGRSGIFPTSLVQLAAAPDYLSTSMDRHGGLQKSTKVSFDGRNTNKEVSCPWKTARGSGCVLWDLTA
uniref:SH3 domain-containing protein n=1 Tax=Meleagris gallopavo TaxID=9103 RepID=A0A803YER5_MELGA